MMMMTISPVVKAVSWVTVDQNVLAEADDVALVVEASADEQSVHVERCYGQLERLVRHVPRRGSAMTDRN